MECKKIMDRTFFKVYIHLPNDTAVIKAKYIFSNENKGQAYVRIHNNFVAASHRILYVLNIEDYRVICEYNICQ